MFDVINFVTVIYLTYLFTYDVFTVFNGNFLKLFEYAALLG